MRIDTLSAGLAGGITAAILYLIAGIITMTGVGINILGMNLGITTGDAVTAGLITVLGMVIVAFVSFFIFGALFAVIYNRFADRPQASMTRHA